MRRIVIERPWWKVWRHPVFPWGWLSLRSMAPSNEEITVDGYHAPSDGGGGVFAYDSSLPDDSGVIPVPSEADKQAILKEAEGE